MAISVCLERRKYQNKSEKFIQKTKGFMVEQPVKINLFNVLHSDKLLPGHLLVGLPDSSIAIKTTWSLVSAGL
jgi:hypothetical protein